MSTATHILTTGEKERFVVIESGGLDVSHGASKLIRFTGPGLERLPTEPVSASRLRAISHDKRSTTPPPWGTFSSLQAF